ncbi:MAG: F0F1 ATP synthase subunit B' [Robiginitomaculum sp.]|nr:MAG: F0F1 ATP synthase subunit B' [Robiginitomaculum sp.]
MMMIVFFDTGKAAEHAAEAAENVVETAEHTSGGMPQLDFSTFPSQIFWLAVAFILLYLALDRYLIPRIGGAIEERKDRIADDLDMAARKKAEADEAMMAYDKSLADARTKANKIAAENRAILDEQLARESATQEAELDKTAAKADAKIAKARAKAMVHVEDIALEVAGEMVTALGGIKADARKLQKALQSANAAGSA